MRTGERLADPLAQLDSGALRGLRFRQQLGGAEPLRSDARARIGDDVGVEAEPLCNAQRVRGSRPPEVDPVERLARVGIEARRRIRDVDRSRSPTP